MIMDRTWLLATIAGFGSGAISCSIRTSHSPSWALSHITVPVGVIKIGIMFMMCRSAAAVR